MIFDGMIDDPDIVTYNSVITALSKDGQLREVKKLVDDMKRAGIAPAE